MGARKLQSDDFYWHPRLQMWVPYREALGPKARVYSDEFYSIPEQRWKIRPNTPVRQKTAYNLYVPKRDARITPIWWSIWCAIAVDASSPVRWSGVTASGIGVTSASYTAPTDCFLVATCQSDGDPATDTSWTPAYSDTGSLAWTNRVMRTLAETTAGGASVIFTATTTSSTSRTSTLNPTYGGAASRRKAVMQYNLTGVDISGTPVDTVGASNEGGSTTNNLTTSSVTPGANGLLICSDCDWSASGSFAASSDLTQDTAHYTGEISVCSGYKTCSSGVGVTGNLNASGTAAVQHKWCQVTVREAAGAGSTRGTPFGHRSTAFNGGRTFLGNIR